MTISTLTKCSPWNVTIALSFEAWPYYYYYYCTLVKLTLICGYFWAGCVCVCEWSTRAVQQTKNQNCNFQKTSRWLAICVCVRARLSLSLIVPCNLNMINLNFMAFWLSSSRQCKSVFITYWWRYCMALHGCRSNCKLQCFNPKIPRQNFSMFTMQTIVIMHSRLLYPNKSTQNWLVVENIPREVVLSLSLFFSISPVIFR